MRLPVKSLTPCHQYASVTSSDSCPSHSRSVFMLNAVALVVPAGEGLPEAQPFPNQPVRFRCPLLTAYFNNGAVELRHHHSLTECY
jgi:hypothetical protein